MPFDTINPDDVKTLDGLFPERVKRSADKAAYRQYDTAAKAWKSITWAEVARAVARWQAALVQHRRIRPHLSRIQAAGYPLEHETHMILLRPRNGIVDAPMWGLTFLRLFRQLTIAGYVRRNVSSSVFTVVTPAALALEDRIAMQRIAVEELLAEYAAAP